MGKMTWDDIKNILSNEEAIRLAIAYSNYVMDGLERGIEPCCIAEFYDNEYQEGYGNV